MSRGEREEHRNLPMNNTRVILLALKTRFNLYAQAVACHLWDKALYLPLHLLSEQNRYQNDAMHQKQ